MPDVLRVANCSGFYGDRLAAAREMVEGGPIDVLTGDYLAELTLLILATARERDPATGYARTLLTQLGSRTAARMTAWRPRRSSGKRRKAVSGPTALKGV